MGFWSKDKVKDSESARNIPRETQQSQQSSKIKESSLTTVPSEDYEVIENDELETKSKTEISEPDESQLPQLPNPQRENSLRFVDEETELQSRLDKLREEKARLIEEQRMKELEEQEQEQSSKFSNEPQQIMYLNDAECLREILRKLDYLILEVNGLKSKS